MQARPLTTLRIFTRDEDEPEVAIPIPEHEGRFFSLGTEQEILLPTGNKISVYAEVSLGHEPPDVLLSIIEGETSIDVRCCGGVIVSYTTATKRNVLFQIGSGAWE